MAFCKNCGSQVSEGKKFCASCGQPVAAEAPREGQYRQGGGQPQSQQGFSQSADRVKQFVQNTADETAGIDLADIQQNKAMGGLAYFLFFLPLVACPNSKYGRFHANQSLIFLITYVGGGIVMAILSTIISQISWRLGWIAALLSAAFGIAIFVLGIMGLINGFSGKAKELPVIGRFRIIK